jgi:Ca-activated chloride channel family protein
LFVIWFVLSFLNFFRDKRDLETLGYQNLVLTPSLAWGRRVLKGLLLLGGFLLILLGAARFQGKLVPEDLNLRGSDVMVVLDVSKSMLTQDLIPNRLEAAKKAILSWMERQDGDQVGVAVFAGQAIVQVPLTLDLQAVALVLERAGVDAVDRGGTDIGEGIRTALAAFPKDNPNKRGRAILLITDGEITNGASKVETACQEAKEKKVPIVAVGIGTPQGRPIPDEASFFGETTYKRDESGNVHVSRLDEKTLRTIAGSTDGIFVQGDSAEGLASIERALDGLQKTEMKGKGGMKRQEFAPTLGIAAAATLLLSALL